MERRKVLAAVLALCLALAFAAPGLAASPDAASGDFTYTVDASGQATITRYSGIGQSSVTVPEQIDGHTVVSIGDGAFVLRAESLYFPRVDITQITLPETIREIGDDAFSGCMALSTLNLPSSVRSIGEYAFTGCLALSSVTIPHGVTEIQSGTFSAAGISSIALPQSVREIEMGAFQGCVNLTQAALPGVETIEDAAFAGCVRLSHLDLPASLASVGDAAFAGCIELDTVSFGGTRAQWEAMRVGQGNGALLSAQITYGHGNPGATLPGGITLRDGSPLTVEAKDGAYQASGYQVARRANAATVGEFRNQFVLPEGVTVQVLENDGQAAADGEVLCTGDTARFTSSQGTICNVTAVVRGDVTGTGTASLTQLVRMAAALSGMDPLTGVYLEAGDFTGSGSITLSDLIREAQLVTRF